MSAMFSAMNRRASHCNAAACSSARITEIMDAAISLVVSIFVVCLISLRLCLCA